MDDLEARFFAGCAVAREAGALARRYFLARHELVVETKGTQDHVSQADREVETLIVEQLGRAFPEDRFLGEEGGGAAADSLWVIDPIDGTSNFLRGLPAWCVSVAYVRNGQIELGIIHDACASELFAARRGHGASVNGVAMRVSGATSIAGAMLGLGFSYRRSPKTFAAVAERLLEAQCEFRRFGAGALAMAHVACGRLDGYWEQHINSWDVLAGILLVREAGGWTNDFLTGDGLLAGNPILACPPALREPLIELTGTC
jgi:myo-inositol-1(or 4)-monophosphatase